MSYTTIEGTLYVDTACLNTVPRTIPGAELRHLGFGEFYLALADGSRVDFIRADYRDPAPTWPGISGRPHEVAASTPQALALFTEACERAACAKAASTSP